MPIRDTPAANANCEFYIYIYYRGCLARFRKGRVCFAAK